MHIAHVTYRNVLVRCRRFILGFGLRYWHYSCFIGEAFSLVSIVVHIVMKQALQVGHHSIATVTQTTFIGLLTSKPIYDFDHNFTPVAIKVKIHPIHNY